MRDPALSNETQSIGDDRPDAVPGAAAPPVGRLLGAALAAAVILLVLDRLGRHWPMALAAWPAPGWLLEFGRARAAGLPAAALLIAASGLAGTWALTRARSAPRLTLARSAVLPVRERRFWRPRWPATSPGRAARWPQAWLVSPLALAGAVCAWLLRPAAGVALLPDAAFMVGGGLLIAAFLLLIVERVIAAWPAARLPEAAWLSDLAGLVLAALLVAGLLEILAGAGLGWARPMGAVAALLLLAIGTELALRPLGRLFLPPPTDQAATAAAGSLLLGLLAEMARGGGLAAPVRRRFGIDFSRGWALSYIRAALPHVLLMLAILAWAGTGLVSVGTSQRAIEERFGRPVAVLAPGLHLIPPWPIAAPRRVEFGPLHELALGTADISEARTGAEDAPPPGADRLWEQAHPAEMTMLIASPSGGGGAGQSFQIMAADLRVYWRVGLTDAAALSAAYAVSDPAGLLRDASGHVAAAYFASRTLDGLLSADLAAIGADLRVALQAEMDRAGSGIEVTLVALEAVHPPAGAAAAYHNVQAAAITAQAQVSAERGRAAATLAANRRSAIEALDNARAGAAESVAAARSDALGFAAEQDAARAGRAPLLLERRLSVLDRGLGGAAVTVLDDRIGAAGAPLLDLRPPGAAGTAAAAGPNE